jgi:hypothetical protein
MVFKDGQQQAFNQCSLNSRRVASRQAGWQPSWLAIWNNAWLHPNSAASEKALHNQIVHATSTYSQSAHVAIQFWQALHGC